MNQIDQLKSVLCDPEGKCCIAGSYEDRAIIDRALKALAEPASVREPVAWLEYARKKPSLRRLVFAPSEKQLLRVDGWVSEPLYASPTPPAEPTAEPVAWLSEDEIGRIFLKFEGSLQSLRDCASEIEKAYRRKAGLK